MAASKGAAKRVAPAAAVAAIDTSVLAKGEKYIGAILGADGKGHHIILLAGDKAGTWDAMMAWAKEQGGDLPDRVEQALLFRDHKDEFKRDWYWSNTHSAGDSGYAWGQVFSYGNQDFWHKDNEFRARAVRRLPIQ